MLHLVQEVICHEASRQFATSVSFVINLMTLYREAGGVE
jgi:hypothetical protein